MTSLFPQCIKPAPTHNQLLAALPTADYQRLLPELELVPMPLGWAVNKANIERRYLYFPTTCVVTKLFAMKDGSTSAVAVVGREGVVGIALIMGGGSAPTRAVVQCAGYAYRMSEPVLKREFSRGGVLQSLVLRYILALIAQVSQTTVCNRHHTLDQRLCRLLLLTVERLPSNQVDMTQEFMAAMLGVRRESVTEAAGLLQVAGIIKYSRGHLTILDIAALQNRCCECFSVVREVSSRLLSYRQVHLENRPLWTSSARQRQLGIP